MTMDAMNTKILLADDDPAILRLLSSVLESAGYQVAQAADGAEALAALEQDQPDFLITDWDMPRLNGLELCRRVRAMVLSDYVYLLFLTGKSSSDAIAEGLGAGADDFIIKPAVPAELLARVKAGGRVLERERRLRELAETDPLTGIPTRRLFHNRLEQEFNRSQRYGSPLSCVMLDIDFFKRVNDTHGHPAGDTVLRAIAGLLTQARRASDLVCRFGGEEFCVMLPETDEDGAYAWAERLRLNLAQLPIKIGDATLNVTASLGVAQRLEDAATCEALVDHADQALLVAKQSGRDRVVNFSSLDDRGEIALLHDANPFHGVLARDIMSSPVPCLRQVETVGQAAEFLFRFRIDSVPVIDEQGSLVGLLSDRDVTAVMLSTDPWQQRVRDIMKNHVISYDESAPAQEVYDFLCRVALRRVVVVQDGRPTGVIGRRNLLRRFHHWLQVTGRNPINIQAALEGLDRRRAQGKMHETTAALVAHAETLRDRMASRASDFVPLIVDEVSQMQELLGDLLALSSLAAGDQGETQPHLPTL
jgi:diguanylate cyclase (GGDEF)-like protein